MHKVYTNFFEMIFNNRKLFMEKETKLIYLDGPSQAYLSCSKSLMVTIEQRKKHV